MQNPLPKFVGFQKVMQYDEKKPARFHIARRDTGELLPQKFVADPFFCFHQVNAYEEDGHVVVDLSTYEDGKIVQTINLENLRKGVETEVGTAKRFVLPVEKEKVFNSNLEFICPLKGLCTFLGQNIQCLQIYTKLTPFEVSDGRKLP